MVADSRWGQTGLMAYTGFDLSTFPVHLGLGATAERLGAFDGTPEWYERYGEAHASDGAEGRLVSLHTFDRPWDSWEMHPNGDELVVCVAGTVTLHQEIDGETRTAVLGVGEAIVNPPGVWHTADVDEPATAVFVTAGMGTEVRPR
jgi:mannose-6-phosphate isomerase-like protein (cupin superfamily)